MTHKWKVWKTLTIGGVSKEDLLARLEDKVTWFWARARIKDIMSRQAFSIEAPPREVSLVRIKFRDLGFTQEPAYPTDDEIFSRAKEYGLYPCPIEVGLQLCLAPLNFPPHLNSWDSDQFDISIEPNIDSDEYPDIFHFELFPDLRLTLDVGSIYSGYNLNLDCEIVFCLRT